MLCRAVGVCCSTPGSRGGFGARLGALRCARSVPGSVTRGQLFVLASATICSFFTRHNRPNFSLTWQQTPVYWPFTFDYCSFSLFTLYSNAIQELCGTDIIFSCPHTPCSCLTSSSSLCLSEGIPGCFSPLTTSFPIMPELFNKHLREYLVGYLPVAKFRFPCSALRISFPTLHH